MLLRRLRSVPIAAPLVLALALACAPGDDIPDVEFRVPVTVREVSTATVEDRVVATGNLRAAETIQLRAETGGELILGRDSRGKRLAEGSRVRAGQQIAEVTGDDVKFAARTESTREAYELAQRDHEQKKRLFEDGLISEAEFMPVTSRLADARLDWERSQLTETRSRLISPIDGVIVALPRDADGTPLADGQRVDQGLEVARLIPDGALIAEVDLIGSDVARVRVGQPVRVRYFAWEDRLWDGQVLRLSPELDPLTRTLRADVAVRDPQRELRPGMFVEVTVVTEQRADVPVVPRQAVTERGGRKVVFRLNGQQVERVEVALGLGDDRIVEIRSGLEPGDRIVVRGLETLTDEQKVRVVGSG